jgi:tetratricopeptide (TPR) repeat protein
LITYCECINDYVRVGGIAEQSLRMARTLSDQQAEALSLLMLGRAISLQGNLREGIPVMEQSLASFRALGDKLGQADAMLWLSWSHNDLERSKALLRESLRLYRELGHLSRIADGLALLAHRTIFGGDFSSPIPWLEEACDLFHQLGNITSQGNVSSNYGLLHYWQGDLEQAQAHYQEALRLYEKVGDIRNAVWSQTQIAYIFLRQGEMDQARETFGVAIQQFRKTNSAIGLVYAVEGLAGMKVNQGQVERAAQLFAWADAMRETINDARPPLEQAEVDRNLAVIHAQLDGVTFQAEQTAGRKLTLDEAIELALSC